MEVMQTSKKQINEAFTAALKKEQCSILASGTGSPACGRSGGVLAGAEGQGNAGMGQMPSISCCNHDGPCFVCTAAPAA
jgi:hypothetical protein